MFANCESKLGKVQFKVYHPEKRFESTVEKIKTKEITTYQRDEHGFLIYDDDEEPIPTGTAIVNDTIWSRVLTTFDKLIYDSNTAENQYWESIVQKTELLIVEIIVHKIRRTHFGCIGLMVGRMTYNPEKMNDDGER